MHNWFNLLCSRGPSFGYHPEPNRIFPIVNEQWRSAAVLIYFWRSWDEVVTGHRFLNGFIGRRSDWDEYVMYKV